MRFWKMGLAVGGCAAICAASTILPALLAGASLAGVGIAYGQEAGFIAIGIMAVAGYSLWRRLGKAKVCGCRAQCDVPAKGETATK